ncbi:MAG: hypothetical protein F6J87_21000 [Spirulina sp. SIO3F2]|nr:hypothetical protein [Spirulina sp. SIO3F2]
MTPIELTRKGFQVLIDGLGYVNAVRFIKQFDQGDGDYTQERSQWLDNLTLEEILASSTPQQKL